MTQRHTLLFGTVLAVAGTAIAADHIAHWKPSAPRRNIATEAASDSTRGAGAHATPSASGASDTLGASSASPSPAPAPVAVPPVEEEGIIEFSPCAASMDGQMAAPVSPAPAPVAPAPAAVAPAPNAVAPAPALVAPAPEAEEEIIEFAPCAAAF